MQNRVIGRFGADDRDAGRPLGAGGERAFGAQRGSQMNEISNWSDAEGRKRSAATRSKTWAWVVGPAALALAALLWVGLSYREGGQAAAVPMPPATVTVSMPLLREVDTRIGFLGQFSPVDRVELRAQVGGTLTEIHFKDGQIVHKGDLLFVIDPRPYEIKLAEATAQLRTASSRFALANSELIRAQALKRSNFGTAEAVDQRMSEQRAAQAAIDDAKAQIRDAQLDIEYCHITAPFTGRIGARLVSIGSLIAGSRPAHSLMLPDSAVMLDQSQQMVMTVSPNGSVVPKPVEIGDLRGGLRVIRSGLAPGDRVIIDGLMHAIPGTKVAPQDGTIRYDAASDGQG